MGSDVVEELCDPLKCLVSWNVSSGGRGGEEVASNDFRTNSHNP